MDIAIKLLLEDGSVFAELEFPTKRVLDVGVIRYRDRVFVFKHSAHPNPTDATFTEVRMVDVDDFGEIIQR